MGDPDAIKGDLAGLESGTKTKFDGNIDKCATWNGDFGSRRKREAGETEEEASNVPSVMESGSSALGWLKAVVRKTRSADPEKKKKAKGKKNKGKGKNSNNAQTRKQNKSRRRNQKSKNNRKRKRKGKKGPNRRTAKKKIKTRKKVVKRERKEEIKQVNEEET